MIEIEYFEDPMSGEPEKFSVESLHGWICSEFQTQDEVLDLRFFEGDIFGNEIPRDKVLDLKDTLVCVVRDSKMPRAEVLVYVALAVVTAIITVALTPKPKIPNTTGRDQVSGTNSLGQTNNEPGLNERIDDLFGTVTKHVPKLWQLPYRIGVDNTEVEVLYLGIGRGKYEVDENEVFDGDTPVKTIPNASFIMYGPDTSPKSGDTPQLQIGPDIDEPIGVYSQSNELNSTELLPPNDLDTTAVTWLLTGVDSSTGVLDINEGPEDFDLRNYFEVGDAILLEDIISISNPVNVTYYATAGPGPSSKVFTIYDYFDLSSELYTLKAVSETSLSVDLTQNTAPVVSEWQTLTDYSPLSLYYQNDDDSTQVILDSDIIEYDWYLEVTLTTPVNYSEVVAFPVVGLPFDNSVGYFTIPSSSTEVILNFVSFNGFLKYINNNETDIEAEVEIVVRELDSNGAPTGNSISETVDHITNPDKKSSTVFQTHRIDVSAYQYKDVLARRITNRDKSDNVSNRDQIEWRDLYFFEPVSVTDFGNATSAHVTIPSNSASRLVKGRKTNLTLTRLVTEYLGNGVFGPAESLATDQFDQILIHASLDPFIGRLQLQEFNADGLLERKQEIVDYFGSDEMTRFGYDFDDTEVTYQDTFSLICDSVNCIPFHQLGIYDCYFEKLQTESSMLITHRNKYKGTENRNISFTDVEEYDGIELTFRNNDDGIFTTIYIPEDQSATNPERIEIPGVTSSLQAWRRAWRLRNKQLHERVKVVFDVDEFGRMTVPGSRIDSPDSTRFTRRMNAESGYRVYDGEVVEVSGLIVELSQPVEFTDGEDHYIQFTNSDGSSSQQILCTEGDTEFKVVLQSLPSESLYDGYKRDRTKFIFASEQARQALPLLVKTIGFKMDSGRETNTITSTNYTDEYYGKDLEQP